MIMMELPLIHTQINNHVQTLNENRIISLCSLINLVKYITYFVFSLITLSNDQIIKFIKDDHIYFPLTITTSIMMLIILSLTIDKVYRNCNHSLMFLIEYIFELIIMTNFTGMFETNVIILFCINIITFLFVILITTFCNIKRINRYISVNVVLVIVFISEILIVYSTQSEDYIKILIISIVSLIIIDLSLYNLDKIIVNDHHCIKFIQQDYIIICYLFILDIINLPYRMFINMNNRT